MLYVMRRRCRLLPLVVLAWVASHAAADAQPAPLCTPEREGASACLDGKLCECRHDPGGTLTGRRAGARWDCGALRPACGPALPPPDVAGQPQFAPPFLPVPVQPGAGGQPQQSPPFFPFPPSPGWR